MHLFYTIMCLPHVNLLQNQFECVHVFLAETLLMRAMIFDHFVSTMILIICLLHMYGMAYVESGLLLHVLSSS